MLTLIQMEEAYRPLLNDMMDEWTATGERIIPYSIRKCDYHDFERYVASLDTREETERLVPDSTFFCLDTDRQRLIGAVNIRHHLNPALLATGGHIGDGIRPSERGKGYGTRMIALALDECRRLGIDRVLMCCDETNRASARTIEKNGGALENTVTQPDGTVVRRYWISLEGAK